MCSILSSANSESFTSSFPICSFYFFFFSDISRTSKTMLNDSDESEHPWLPDLRGSAFSFPPLRIVFSVNLSYMAFSMLRLYQSIPIFWSGFYHKCILNFVNGFYCIYWGDHMVFIFQFVNMVYHIDWFVYIEESLHPWNKPNLIMCMSFLMCCWTLFASTLLKIFTSMLISDIGL